MDIVERLRARPSELAHEAADEIVALRKRLAKREKEIALSRVRAVRANEVDEGGVRNTDPETSVVAAGSVNIDHLKYAVLTTLRDANSPLNCCEIAERIGTTRDTITPRMPPLRSAELIEVHGLRLWEPSGRDQTSYVLTERGKQAVAQRPVPPNG